MSVMILQCHVDDRTLALLEKFARESGRTIEELAEAAISEAAIQTVRPGEQP